MKRVERGTPAPGAPTSDQSTSGKPKAEAGLIPRDFVRIIAIWSLIPSYLFAGGLVGYGLDRWFGLFPYLTGVGLLVALAAAVRDMYRLKDEM